MSKPLKLLLIEDAEDDALLLMRELRRGGYAPEWQRVDTAEGLRAALAQGAWQVVISDYRMPQFSALDALAILKQSGQDLPFIIVSGAIGEDTAVAAMRAGAHDYLMKGQITRLIPAIEREIHEAASRQLHRRTEAQRAFLIELSTVLASSIDYQTTLANLVHQVVPKLADYCIIDLRKPDGSFERAATAHANPAKQNLLDQLQRSFPPNPHSPLGIASVMQSGQPRLNEQIDSWLLESSASDAEHLRLLRELNPQSSMLLPITIHGRGLGVITLASANPHRRYGPDDLVLAEEVARRAGLAVDNARLYQDAQAARAHAEQAVQLRDQFLSLVAHELRTPLTSLKGYAELFQRRAARDGNLNERDRHTLRVIVNQTDRLNRMMTALFDLSRIQLGQLSIERAPIDIGALVHQIVEEIQPTLAQHTIEFQRPDTPLLVDGDALRLEQVIQNLLQNAIKYSPLGGVIELQLERRGEWACVAVTDHGIGIPQAALSQLFQRFYRADNVAAQQISGMGIGLYVVKEIVILHGGAVEVTSAEGQGSTFTIRLPWLGDSTLAEDRRQLEQVGSPE